VSDPAPVPAWQWAVRAGYVLAPSPVPRQTGFTTFLDATRHGLSIGGGYHIGKLLGVDLSANLVGEIHILAAHSEAKPNTSLPHARYDVSGHIWYGAASLEAEWR
jgi:long-subunit fatty acid transport protein